ncbi:hypothetical protein H206_03153 [Candidatus Electrothrix aarhusensis]|uniref:Uncharacterized protein n=1 Tax=Candidatus Electrothrix aarhusensis TaxID=1859131 RepID=A0A3S3QQH4_9BACT|nr:hypothetical protein H206_03153 [Candidatus Electrothrix aarhusensis]
MSSLFPSSSFSRCIGKSLGPSSPSVIRTVPGTDFKQNKEKGAGKEKNSLVVRRNIQMFFGLLTDFVLFYFLLAVDAAMTAEIFLRARFGVTESR